MIAGMNYSSEVSSDQPDDDDGHDDCGKGEFYSCHDNPRNFYPQRCEDHSVDARYMEWNSFSEAESSRFSNSTGESTSQDEGEFSTRVGDYLEPDPEETWRELFRGGVNAENDGYAHETQELA